MSNIVYAQNTISWWLTRGDQSALLQKQKQAIAFGNDPVNATIIKIDTNRKYQRIDGFGFALTGSSAFLINHMDASSRNALLNELFGTGVNDIGISTLRISIGSSDLSPAVYFYDDVPPGQEDMSLAHFDLGKDKETQLPLLQQILKLSPKLKIIASPWSAPIWMKDNQNAIGGTLKTACYKVYADYLVKYLQNMQQAGITIDAITPQNEPLNGNNNPSMVMTAQQEGTLIKTLSSAIKVAGLKTKIIAYDHNCDNLSYARTLMSDEYVRKAIAGTGFHLYAGEINAMGTLHNEFPEKNLYFTEQYTDAKGDFGGDLKWHMKNVVTGALRNWSRNVIEWNLANDPSFGPHTQGGCSTCKGALTINGSSVKRNVSYYIIAHVSKFVPQGSLRIFSDNKDNLNTAAFITSDGHTVSVVENDGNADVDFSFSMGGKTANATIPAGSVATYMW